MWCAGHQSNRPAFNPWPFSTCSFLKSGKLVWSEICFVNQCRIEVCTECFRVRCFIFLVIHNIYIVCRFKRKKIYPVLLNCWVLYIIFHILFFPGKSKEVLLGYPTRCRSCALVNTPSLCVNKVIHLIQELEVKLEKFFQQVHMN